MGLLIRLVELLVILVPLVGVLVAGMKAFSAARRNRPDEAPTVAAAPAAEAKSHAARWQSIVRAVREHDRTDTRWLDYEMDIAKLLDFPLMTDMANPLTERFHRAKLRAGLLRPADAGDLLDNGEAASSYLEAVTDYVTAFDIAEAEAIRRRRGDFAAADQQRIGRAQSMLRVAADSAATPQERERAYHLAGRELDGLIVLPEAVRATIERGIAGELGS